MPVVANVSTGKPNGAGSIFRAPIGTTIPAGAKAELDEAFVQQGYVSEDGVTNSNSASVDTGKAWGGDIVITYQTEKPDTFQFTLIESLNPDVLKTVYGEDHVTGTIAAGLTVEATSDEADESVWVIDQILRNDTIKRIVIPNGKITEMGDVVYKDDELIGYEITIQAFPYEGNKTHKEYFITE